MGKEDNQYRSTYKIFDPESRDVGRFEKYCLQLSGEGCMISSCYIKSAIGNTLLINQQEVQDR